MFNTMMEGIKEESVAYLFNSQVEVQQNPIVEEAGAETPAVAPAFGQLPGPAANGGAPATGIQDAADAPPADAPPADARPANGRGAERRGAGGRGSDGREPGGQETGGRGTGGRTGGRGGRRSGGKHAAGSRSGGGAAAAAPPEANGSPAVAAPGLSGPQKPGRLSYSAPTVDGEAQVERRSESASSGEFGKVGRNAPCPCGSGKKYKLCHGDPRSLPAG